MLAYSYDPTEPGTRESHGLIQMRAHGLFIVASSYSSPGTEPELLAPGSRRGTTLAFATTI